MAPPPPGYTSGRWSWSVPRWARPREPPVQGHAADHAGTVRVSFDLRVHRAGALAVHRDDFIGPSYAIRGEQPRIDLELRLTFLRAKMKGLLLKISAPGVGADRNRHPADRVP